MMRLDRLAPSEPSPEPSPSPGPSSPADEAASIEGLAFEGEVDSAVNSGAAGAGVLTREQFAAGLRAAFALSGGLVGLNTLRQAPEQPSFPPACDALYDTASEVPWLRFLISPDSIWLQRAIAIGAFAVPLGAGCAAELRARRLPRPAPAADSGETPAQTGDSQPLDG